MSATGDRTWLDTSITPHLALGRTGRMLVSFALLVPAAVLGTFLTVFHAWPATYFVGGEALLAIAALHWSARRLSGQGERVVLTDRDLIIESWDNGTSRRDRLEPAWVSLERRDHAEFGCEAVYLRISRRRWRIGAALGSDARGELADRLKSALDARRHGFFNGV